MARGSSEVFTELLVAPSRRHGWSALLLTGKGGTTVKFLNNPVFWMAAIIIVVLGTAIVVDSHIV